jgi:branched-chain amino acid transport system substrate-binding protein
MRTLKILTIVLLIAMIGSLAGCKQAFECTDPRGCVDIAPDDPIRIGYMMVLSGGDASLGTDTKRGAEIAVDDQKEVLGHSIELIGEDSLCAAEGGQTAATKLAADPTLVAVIGTNCSSAARAAIPIMCNAGIPMISPSNTAPDLTAEDRPDDYWCYLRTAHNDFVQGAVAANFAWEVKGATQAATIHDGSIYADQLQQVFVDNFVELGGTVVAQEATDPKATDMKPMLTRIAATHPEFLYVPIFIEAGGHVVKQSKETPGMDTIPIMGADGMFSPDFLRAAGDAALGLYWSGPAPSGAAYEDFLTKHETKYGEKTLAPFHAHSYDAAMLIFKAIEKVAVEDSDGTLHIGRQALRDELFATKDYKGLTGNLTCSPTGDCADPNIAVFECMSADPATWNPGRGADNNPKAIWP